MVSAGLGALCAVSASALFSAGLVLQSVEARRVPARHALRLSLIGRLLRRPRWVAGAAAMGAGFVLHVVALTLASLTVVQPALAAGLLLLPVIGARLHAERVGAGTVAGLAAIALGIAAITLTAPGRTDAEGAAGTAAFALVLGGLAGLALLPHLISRIQHSRDGSGSRAAALGAGAAYALTGITTKLLSDRVAAGAWAGAALWLAVTMAVAMLALIDQTTALQRLRATEVGPVIYVVPVIVPVLLAPVLVGEGWAASPGRAAVLAAALAVVCVALTALSRTPAAAAGLGAGPAADEPAFAGAAPEPCARG